MKLNVTKTGEDSYTLEFYSGHFSGKLESISDEMINDLIKALIDIKNNTKNEVEWVWNPRSQRREKRVKEVPQTKIYNVDFC